MVIHMSRSRWIQSKERPLEVRTRDDMEARVIDLGDTSLPAKVTWIGSRIASVVKQWRSVNHLHPRRNRQYNVASTPLSSFSRSSGRVIASLTQDSGHPVGLGGDGLLDKQSIYALLRSSLSYLAQQRLWYKLTKVEYDRSVSWSELELTIRIAMIPHCPGLQTDVFHVVCVSRIHARWYKLQKLYQLLQTGSWVHCNGRD